MDKLALIALKKSGSTDVSAAVAAKVAAQAAQSAAETAQAAAEDAAEDAVEALASEYSTSSTYAVGDYCVKDGVLYRCTTAISTAESWTAAHWTATKVTTELASDYSSLKSQITSKAETNGAYDEMTVGSAEQLLSAKGLTDKVPYLFRRSGGNGANRAKEQAIVGGTIAWNQIIRYGDFTDASKWSLNKSNSKSVENNVLTVTLNENATGSTYLSQQNLAPGISDHVYLYSVNVKPSRQTKVWLSYSNYFTNTKGTVCNADAWTLCTGIVKAKSSDATFSLYISDPATLLENDTISFKNFNVFDLTQMFGSTIAGYIYSLEQATAGAGVAKLRSWGLFTKDYYEYDAGSLQSVQVAAKKEVGFNQFDKASTLTTGFLYRNGEQGTSSSYKYTDYIPIVGGQTYRVNGIGGNNPAICWYDADKNYIDGEKNNEATSKNITFPVNARYTRISFPATNVDVLCLHLKGDGSRDGEYEPYSSHTYPLDSTLTLRGIPELDADNNLRYNGDTYAPDGTVTRKFSVHTIEASELSIAASDSIYSNVTPVVISSIPNMKRTATKCAVHEKFGNAVNGYPFDSIDNVGKFINDAGVSVYWFGFAKGTTLDQAKSQLVGTKIVYEIESPTTETADPYQETQLLDTYGTEEYIDAAVTATTPTRDVAVPVGHETYYPENAAEKLAGLPWDFSTLIANTEKGFTATQPYSVNDFLIVNNQLYRVTASIANGATITPNTNVTATTLGAQITALLNA